MKLEQQVCSLELAKRPKELGAPQSSYFHWFEGSHGVSGGFHLASYTDAPSFYEANYCAFTVAELGEMLPLDCRSRRSMDEKGKWLVDALSTDHFFRSKTEADARAKMLIYLLENHLYSTPGR